MFFPHVDVLHERIVDRRISHKNNFPLPVRLISARSHPVARRVTLHQCRGLSKYPAQVLRDIRNSSSSSSVIDNSSFSWISMTQSSVKSSISIASSASQRSQEKTRGHSICEGPLAGRRSAVFGVGACTSYRRSHSRHVASLSSSNCGLTRNDRQGYDRIAVLKSSEARSRCVPRASAQAMEKS
jgi:hypothetical protein